jgi:predicted acylesterase/phospholipase RssA
MSQAEDTRIAVSLSGGGHRATLYGLGTLMALVDRGLNRRIVQVSSVSGGSILNAVLVHRGVNLDAITSEQFDRLAGDVASAIARRGVLTRGWLTVALVVIAGCGALAGWGYAQTPAPPVLLFLAVAIGAGVPLLWSGHFVTWRLRRVFLPGAGRQPLGQLSRTPLDHVFCTSDLITGFPVYITTWDGGLLWRRTDDLGVIGGRPETSGQLWSAKHLKLAEVVRASAGFPGIPPRRLSVGGRRGPGQDSQRLDRPLTFGGTVEPDPGWDDAAVMLLSDGGIVNNLGTQPLREDRFYRGEAGIAHPQVLISANASAPIMPRHRWPYYFPGLSLISQLWRCLQVQNMNTVAPRVAATRVALRRRSQAGAYSDDVDLIINLSESPGMLKISLRHAMEEHRDTLRARSPDHRDWEGDLAYEVRHWVADHLYSPADSDIKEALIETLKQKVMDEPREVPPVPGILDHDALGDVTSTQWWANLENLEEKHGQPQVPTTLGRFPPDIVQMLVLRGYMHAYLASVAIRPWDQDLGAAARVRERIASFGLA